MQSCSRSVHFRKLLLLFYVVTTFKDFLWARLMLQPEECCFSFARAICLPFFITVLSGVLPGLYFRSNSVSLCGSTVALVVDYLL
jgi:hypothetical protein